MEQPIFAEELVCLSFADGRHYFSRVVVHRLSGSRYQAVHTHGKLGSRGTTHILLQEGSREEALAAARQKIAERRAEGYLLLSGVIRALEEEARRQARELAGDMPAPMRGRRLLPPASRAGSDRAHLSGSAQPARVAAAPDSPAESGEDGGALSDGIRVVLQYLDNLAGVIRQQVSGGGPGTARKEGAPGGEEAGAAAPGSREREDLARYAEYRSWLIRRRTAEVLGLLAPSDPWARTLLERLAEDPNSTVRRAAQAALSAARESTSGEASDVPAAAAGAPARCRRCGSEIDAPTAQKIAAWARGEGGWDLDPTFIGYRAVLCLSCQKEIGVFRHRAERQPDGTVRWVPLERKQG